MCHDLRIPQQASGQWTTFKENKQWTKSCKTLENRKYTWEISKSFTQKFCNLRFQRNATYSDISKWCGIPFLSHMCCNLSHNTLDKLSNCHSRGNSMWVDNNIRSDAFHSPRHVFLCVSHANSSLLTMPTTKLVSNLRYADRSDPYFHKPQPISICCKQNLQKTKSNQKRQAGCSWGKKTSKFMCNMFLFQTAGYL